MKKIILVGPAACGKTHLAEEFERHGYKANLSVTTRPMREGEEHMKHYNFMSDEEFNKAMVDGNFWEVKEFNGWRYGTLKTEWEEKQLFIFTPSGVEGMSQEDIDKSLILYIDVDEDVRRERLSKRSDADKVERRIEADKKDFSENTVYQQYWCIHYPSGNFDAKETMLWLLEEAGEDPEILKALK